MRDKRLLVLGAGRGQIGLYKAAREMGITTIAVTLPDNNPPCLPLADEVCYANIVNPDEVEIKTSGLVFDGVATCCLDRGVRSLGRLCDKYSLPGFSESTAELCNDKFRMKQRLEACGVNTASFRQIGSEQELIKAVEEVGNYPVIIKATDLAGSKGIYKAENRDEALSGFRKAMQDTKKDYLIVEKFLQGREFGAQAFVVNGELLFVMPHGDLLYYAATAVPVGHYVPFDCDVEMREKIELETRKAIFALELDNCAVNIDFIEENGNIYVLELSGRAGANCLPELTGIYYGLNYYKLIVAASLGLDVRGIWNKRRVGRMTGISKMVISTDKSGILENIAYQGEKFPYIYDMTFFVEKGQYVHKFENSSHCLAQVVVSCSDYEECEVRINDVMKQIVIDIDE
ncbi:MULTISPECIES: ATP-grasp domain-containing protein [Butyricimonas]|uniref:ATP-grasp domain-containing protein n=1 Tax=Butyricimonas TaxID=574697 RepID=UPI0007FB5099|nr:MULTISPECIES: ATP-grasp domain-containing protein [Butyricimonas]